MEKYSINWFLDKLHPVKTATDYNGKEYSLYNGAYVDGSGSTFDKATNANVSADYVDNTKVGSSVTTITPNTGWSVPSAPSWSYTNADLAQSYGMDRSTAYQEALANTSHQREVADLKAAGLNPVLSANGGSGAAVFSGSALSTSAGGGGSAAAQPLLNANSAKAFGALAGALIAAATHTRVSAGSSIGSKAGEVVAAIANPR